METLTPTKTFLPLREYRRARNLSQEYIADLLGVKQSTISEAENGNVRAIGSDNWDKLADFFDVDPRVLKGRKKSVNS